MIECNSLEEAQKVPNVIAIEAGTRPKAWQQGDTLPSHMTIDQAQVAAEQARADDIDASIATTTIGGAQPATVAQLKAMTRAEYATWFDANFTTLATCVALLRRLTLIVIRRVL